MTPTIRKKKNNEKTAFDMMALKTVFQGQDIPADIQEKISRAEQTLPKIKKKRPQFNTLSCGENATVFFIKNPSLIRVMLAEADKRHQKLHDGEDVTSLLLDNEDLYRFCRDRSTAIYTQDESDCHNYMYSSKYRRIQSNFVWTMEQAALSAQMALDMKKQISQLAPRAKTEVKAEVQTNGPYPLSEAERHAAGFFDWADKHITPAQYDQILDDDHQNQNDNDDISVPSAPVSPVPACPTGTYQPILPGLEHLVQKSTPRIRKITRQKFKLRPLSHTRQYGS